MENNILKNINLDDSGFKFIADENYNEVSNMLSKTKSQPSAKKKKFFCESVTILNKFAVIE